MREEIVRLLESYSQKEPLVMSTLHNNFPVISLSVSQRCFCFTLRLLDNNFPTRRVECFSGHSGHEWNADPSQSYDTQTVRLSAIADGFLFCGSRIDALPSRSVHSMKIRIRSTPQERRLISANLEPDGRIQFGHISLTLGLFDTDISSVENCFCLRYRCKQVFGNILSPGFTFQPKDPDY